MEFNRIIKYFFLISCLVYGAIGLIIYCYQNTVTNNDALYSEETCLKFIEEDLLGKPMYSQTCPRYLYENEIRKQSGVTWFFFTFDPTKGKQLICPAVTVLIDRRSGEFWIIDVDKKTID